MVIPNRLQHIGILVSDADEAAKWYQEMAGFTYVATFFSSGSKVVFVRSASTSVLCELIQRPEGSTEAKDIAASGGRVDHIAYECDDLESAFAEAKQLDMDIIEGIVDIPEFWSHGFRYFLTRSTTGEKVEFCKVND